MTPGQPSLLSLNEEQKRAVERENQDVCVVAGPGSGKTRVLVERFAWLVSRGIDPETILVITFTEKAANELKERLTGKFTSQPDLRRKIERAHISTIHGFCHAILREHALAAGIDPRFQILDEVDHAALCYEAMQEALDQIARESRDEFARLAAVWSDRRMDMPLLNAYAAMRAAGAVEPALKHPPNVDRHIGDIRSRLRESLQSAASVNPAGNALPLRLAKVQELLRDFDNLSSTAIAQELKGIHLQGIRDRGFTDAIKQAREISNQLKAADALRRFLPQRRLLIQIILRFQEIFRLKKRSNGFLDFSDLEDHVLDLLNSDKQIFDSIKNRFEHILMDELQDTNPVQWEILSRIRRPQRFFAVGDVNQSIYGFRHAEPALFRQFEQSVSASGGTVDRLSRNYRSRREILEAVSRILVSTPQPGIEPHTLEAAAPFPDSASPCIEILCADSSGEGAASVSLWLAARLRELYGAPLANGVPARFEHMAIFVRNTSSFADIEHALTRFSIPYVVAGGKSFFDAQEIIDLLNALRVFACPEDEIALFSLLRSPFFGCGDEDLLLRKNSGSLATPEQACVLSRLRSKLAAEPASLVLSRLIDESGYAARLSPPLAANVEKFLSILDRLERRHGRDVSAILRQLELLHEAQSEPPAPVIDAGDAVRLMTIHKAKGLEFPIVAVAALEKGERPDRDAAAYHPDCGLGFRWQLGEERLSDWIMEQARSRRIEKSANESNRLLYVALTRAEERLILSFTKTSRPGPWPGLILGALGLEFPSEPGGQSRSGLAILTRVTGPPSVPPAPNLHAPAPPPEIDPLAPPRQAPSEITVTALANFAHCPRRYLLDSVLHWPLPHSEGGNAMALGTEVHEYLAGVRSDVSGEARALAQVFQQSGLGRRAARAQHRKHEMDFLVELDGSLLRGQIDLWFDEGHGPVLVDYKTDRFLGEARLRGYELQMRLYACALQQLTGMPVREAWLFPLRQSEPHPVDIAPQALQDALHLLRQWRAAEESGEFPVREAPDCRWCPYASGPCPVARPADPGL